MMHGQQNFKYFYDICETEISTIYSDDVEQYYATYIIISLVFY